ncbi:MAG: hypothetical protein AB1420_18065 [Bacillota bacterium]
MLEGITNISECEELLKKQGLNRDISFIGQLDLTQDDTIKLRDLIYNQIRRDINNGVEYVLECTPLSLVFLLVNEAIWNYKQGQYWSLDEVLPEVNNVALQNKLGEFFLGYIKSNGLNYVEIEGAHRFVGPILLHAGIPQSCLADFFEEVVTPLIKLGIISSTEIKAFLTKIRDQNSKRLTISNEIKQLKLKLHDYNNKMKQLTSLIELRNKYDEYEIKLCNSVNISSLPENFKDYKTIKLKELSFFQEKIKDWENQRIAIEAIINLFGPKEQALLDSLSNLNVEIERLQEYEKQAKNRAVLLENFNKAKQQLSLELLNIFQVQPELESEIVFNSDRLLSFIDAYYQLKNKSDLEQKERAKVNNWLERLIQFVMSLFSFKKDIPTEKTESDGIYELRKGIEETLREIYDSPLKEELFLYSYEEFRSLVQIVAEITDSYNKCFSELHAHDNKFNKDNVKVCEIAVSLERETSTVDQLSHILLEVYQAHNKRKNAYLAKIKLDKTIIPALKELTQKKQNIERELKEKERIFLEFGKGDLEKGISAVQDLKSIEKNKKKVIKKIKQFEKSLQIRPGSENHILDYLNRQISTQLTQLRKLLNFKQKELSSYPMVYPYADEPVRRFLLYGGDWADDFIVQGVKLVNIASGGKLSKNKTVQLPERVITFFEQWWHKGHERELYKVGSRGERLVAPALTLDPVYKRIKLLVGKMRFNYAVNSSFQTLSMVVAYADGTTILATRDLRAYFDSEGLIETLPVEINLDFLKDIYLVEIHFNNTLLASWSISGLGPNEYILVFSEDGRKQDVKKLRSSRYWFIVEKGIVIDPALRVIEEAQLDLVDKSYQMVLIDLSNVKFLKFTDKKGVRHRIPVQEWSLVIPDIKGGEEIPNVSIDGTVVYSGKLPSIKIPFHEKSDLSYWLLKLENEKGECVIQSIISQFKALEIDKDGQNAWLDLNNQSLLGPLDIGLYNIILYYLGQEIKTYKLAYLPGFRVNFKQKIYPPKEKETIQEVKLRIVKMPNTELIVHQPAKILHEETSSCDISTNFNEDSLSCDIKAITSTTEMVIFPINISIPKLRWRLLDFKEKEFFEWSDKLEEMWFGKLEKAEGLVLEVRYPTRERSSLQLYMNDYIQELIQPLNDGKAQFKLTSFIDSIRSSNLPVQVFSINLIKDRDKIRVGPVLRVRSKWEVYGFKYSTNKGNNGYSMELQWLEKGEAEQRVVRFWHLEEPWREPYVQHIPVGQCFIVLYGIEQYLSEGRHLISFDVEDSWNPQVTEFPSQDYNTFLVDINYGETYLNNCSIQVINTSKAIVTGEFLNVPPLAKVEVSLLSIDEGGTKIIKKESYAQGGKFSLSLKNKDLGQIAHWIIIKLPDEPFYYRVLTVVEGAQLEWPIGENRDFIKQLLGLSNIRLKLVYSDNDSTKAFDLEELTRPVLSRLIEKKDFTLDSKYPVKTAKLRWVEKERQVYLDLPTEGVICNTCGQFFQNQEGWYAHNPFSRCKRLSVKVYEAKAQLLCFLDFKEIYSQFFMKYPVGRDNSLVLFSSKIKPFPKELGLNPLQNLKGNELVEIFLKKEIEICNKLVEVLTGEL